MWKRLGGVGYPFFILLFWAALAGAALAVCSKDEQPPPVQFSWPANGKVTGTWTLDCKTDKGHRGIDISAGAGATVRSAAAGIVSFVGYTPAEGGGSTVAIDHGGGWRTTYLHLFETSVKKGQEVGRGEPIGLTDERPLHFGVKLAGDGKDVYYNPEELLPPLPDSETEARSEGTESDEETQSADVPAPVSSPPSDQSTSAPGAGLENDVAEPAVSAPQVEAAPVSGLDAEKDSETVSSGPPIPALPEAGPDSINEREPETTGDSVQSETLTREQTSGIKDLWPARPEAFPSRKQAETKPFAPVKTATLYLISSGLPLSDVAALYVAPDSGVLAEISYRHPGAVDSSTSYATPAFIMPHLTALPAITIAKDHKSKGEYKTRLISQGQTRTAAAALAVMLISSMAAAGRLAPFGNKMRGTNC